ncbi:MAG: response regulator [Caulobacter sp.]
MIIEDDLLIAGVLAQHLKDLGYGPASIAMTANEAFAAVELEAPALILADTTLADGESGLEIAQAVHARRHVPLVFVSARPELASGKPGAVQPSPQRGSRSGLASGPRWQACPVTLLPTDYGRPGHDAWPKPTACRTRSLQ